MGRPATGGIPALALVAVVLGALTVGLASNALTPSLPILRASFHSGFDSLEWVLNAYSVALLTGLIPAGRIADLVGRKKVFLIGAAGLMITLPLMGLSTGTTMLIGLRALQGLAAAALLSAGLGALRDLFPVGGLPWAFGAWGAALALSMGGGPLILALLAERESWRIPFYGLVLPALLTLVFGAVGMRDSRRTGIPRPLDVVGVALLTVTLFLLSFGLANEIADGWSTPLTLLPLVAAAGLGVAFVLVSVLVQPALFASRTVAAGLVTLLGFFTGFGTLTFANAHLQTVDGMNLTGMGVRLLPMGATFLLASIASAALTRQFGARPPLVAGALLIAVPAFGFALVDAGSLTPAFVLVCLAVLGLGLGLVAVAGAFAAIGDAAQELPAVAAGFQQAALALGGILASSVLGSMVSSRVSSVTSEPGPGFPGASVRGLMTVLVDAWQNALLVAGVVALVAAVVALLVRPRPR
ncbi:MFS transporter [Actinomadura scrupuli]|uniref:MFS transporter n=1 Tax=Actinomadura scrupuli TaxID=559629 RepID=UPI003D99E212